MHSPYSINKYDRVGYCYETLIITLILSLFFLSFSQILDGALCRAFKVQREFVSSLKVTHLTHVGLFTYPGIDSR